MTKAAKIFSVPLVFIHIVLLVFVINSISAETHYTTDYHQFSVFAAQWNKDAHAGFDLDFTRSFADVNGDLSVDILDLIIISENWTEMGTLYDISNMYQQVRNTQLVNAAIQHYFLDHGQLPKNDKPYEFELCYQTDAEGTIIYPPLYPCDNLFGRYLDNIPFNWISFKDNIRFDGPSAGAKLADWRFDTQTGIFKSDYPCTMQTIAFHGRTVEWPFLYSGPANI